MSTRMTMGQLLVNEALPERLRDPRRKIDSDEIIRILQQVADDPEEYKKVVHQLLKVGEIVAHKDGMSIQMKDVAPSPVRKVLIDKFRKAQSEIYADSSLTPDQRNEKVMQLAIKMQPILSKSVLDNAKKNKNRLAELALSKVRGNPGQVSQVLGAVGVVTDNKGRPVPFPILSSFSDGLDPAEYWATTYGVRKGYHDLKIATPKAGYFSKQLAAAAHRLTVGRGRPMEGTGFPVATDDPYNEGAVLARKYGPYDEGTVITPKIMKDLKKRHKRILVHSPISSIAEDGSLPQWAVGAREKGGMHPFGENVGMPAAQAIAEPLSQAMISSKHTAGVVGATGKGGLAAQGGGPSGFDVVERMANVPKNFPGKAVLAEKDGAVTGIQKAPQGGYYVSIGDEKHYIDVDSPVSVKVGQNVEAGDSLSEGLPNPADVVRLRGIGDGRRFMVEKLQEVLHRTGVKSHRRNVEILARAFIDHVELDDTVTPGSLPGDIVSYDTLAAKYKPRDNSQVLSRDKAKGMYLERPALHYSIGTRVTPRVLRELKEFDVNDITVNKEPPKFHSIMRPVTQSLPSDPDWQVQLGGTGLKKNFLESLHRGATSTTHGTSYIPALAQGIEFGRNPGTAY